MTYKLGLFPEDVVLAYLAYPYTDDPPRRTREVVEIANELIIETGARVCPLVPHYMFDLLLGKFIEAGNWLFVMDWEMAVIERCDIFIKGCELDYAVSPGMVWEAAYARSLGKPVLSVEEVVKRYKA